MKRKPKRILSLMLCIMMTAGLLAPTASAMEPTKAESQIGAHFEVDHDSGALPDTAELVGDTSKLYAHDQLKTDKTIAAGEKENEFLITLSVKTRELLRETTSSEDAAVVIVLDLSEGMRGKNLADAKKAALNFIEKFSQTEDTNTKRRIAVVGFSGLPWQGGLWGGRYGLEAAHTYQSWTEATDASIKNSINNMKAEGGTCLQAGLVLARNLLNQGEVKDFASRNIIVLTDGEPTYHLSPEATKNTSVTSIGSPEQIRGSGSIMDHDTHLKTEETAKAVAAKGINVYGIHIGNKNIDCTKQGCALNKTGGEWLREDCGFNAVYAVDDVWELAEKFADTTKQMGWRVRALTASDPLGEMFTFAGFAAHPASGKEVTYDESSDTVQWDLRLSEPAGSTVTEQGFKEHEYRLSYKVELNTDAEGYRPEVYYPTNGITSVEYLIENLEKNGDRVIEQGTAYFNVPSVKGFAPAVGSLLVEKTLAGPGADPQDEFTFTVTLSDSTVSGTYGDMSFESGIAVFHLRGGESVTAPGLPAGTHYTVSESPFEGYTASVNGEDASSAAGTIAAGEVARVSFLNYHGGRMGPEPEYGELIVEKTVSGTGASREENFSFTVALSDTSVNGTYDNMHFTDGVAELSLKHGESATASGIPAGTAYTVTENSSDGYVVTVNDKSASSAQGVIKAGEISVESFNNHRDAEPAAEDIRFEISKTVEVAGEAVPAEKSSFEFVVSASRSEADVLASPIVEVYGAGTQTVSVSPKVSEKEQLPHELYVWEKDDDAPAEWIYDASVYRVSFAKDEAGVAAVRYERLVTDGVEESWEQVEKAEFLNIFYGVPVGPDPSQDTPGTPVGGDETETPPADDKPETPPTGDKPLQPPAQGGPASSPVQSGPALPVVASEPAVPAGEPAAVKASKAAAPADVPKTGDAAEMGLWLALGGASLCGFSALTAVNISFLRRRRKIKEDA